jgi:concanavalin A-like lectin/glucanase superfamily protein/uncharacterized protein DUF2341
MAFSFSRTLTIDHTKCGSADSTNFPVLFSGTYSWLATVANGGHVQSSSGYDIVFASDAAGTSLLSFERANYNASTGLVEFWVKIPTVSHTTDTVIYILYGDSSVTTDQQSATGTWSNGYQGVWHGGDGTTLSLTDSLGNSTSTNHSATATAGQISGAIALTAAPHWASLGGSSALNFTTVTMEFWMQSGQGAGTTTGIFLSKRGPSFVGGYEVYNTQFGFTVQINDGTNTLLKRNTSVFTVNTWHHVLVSISGNTVTMWMDGVSKSFTTTSGSATGIASSTNPLALGALPDATFPLTGVMDEIRVSNVARGADYALTSYNNQHSPSTFYTVGSEVGSAPPVSAQPCFFVCM